MVAAPLLLAALERGAAADGDEHVLEHGSPPVVGVDVARRDRPDAERGGEVAQERVPARVPAFVRALQLDVEAVAAEGACEPGGRVRVADREAVASAAREADEPLVLLLEQRLVELRRPGLAVRRVARVRVRRRQQPAEVPVAACALHEQRDVAGSSGGKAAAARPADRAAFGGAWRLVRERDLGAGDRPHAELLRGVRELERAVDAVVVGERERLVAELSRAGRELLRLRGAVEERVRRVRVQLDVGHDPLRWTSRSSRRRARASASGSTAFSPSCPHIEALELYFPADFEGVDPHTHADHTDSFYFLEGEAEFLRERRMAPRRARHVPFGAAERRARIPPLRCARPPAQLPHAERGLHRTAAGRVAPSKESRRTHVRVRQVMHELPERLLVRAERDVVDPVGRVQEAGATAGPAQVPVVPDDPALLRVDDDDAVVVVVVDRDVPVREHDRERRVVQCAPAEARAVAPAGLCRAGRGSRRHPATRSPRGGFVRATTAAGRTDTKPAPGTIGSTAPCC